MKVTYRANGEVRDITDAAARQLIDARICDSAEPKKEPPPKKSDKSDRPTKVEPMTTEDTPFVPTKTVT